MYTIAYSRNIFVFVFVWLACLEVKVLHLLMDLADSKFEFINRISTPGIVLYDQQSTQAAKRQSTL